MAPERAFHFLVPVTSEAERERLCNLDVEQDWRAFAEGTYAWSLQTFLRLKQSGFPVTCSGQLQEGCINIGHAAYLRTLSPRHDVFVVSLRADYPPTPWARLHVVQNQTQLKDATTVWMPHWPQPGLITRDPVRREVRHVAYAGRPYWLAETPDRWKALLRPLGLEFRLLDPEAWNDFSDVDILLAIRSFDSLRYRGQPPTKLLNAWHAGIPLVAGNDSAFAQIGTPGENYLVATTEDEALLALRRLKEDPSFYERIVMNGREKALQFSREQITTRWEKYLRGNALQAYESWVADGGSTIGWRLRVMAGRVTTAVRTRVRRTAWQILGDDTLHRIRKPFR